MQVDDPGIEAAVIEDLGIVGLVGVVPEPPALLAERLKREDKVWRWLMTGHTRWQGKRGYESVSLNVKEREWVDRHAPFGLHVGADNTLRWREDGWLAAMPRRLREHIDRAKAARNREQSATADGGVWQEAVRRAGGKVVRQTVERHQGPLREILGEEG